MAFQPFLRFYWIAVDIDSKRLQIWFQPFLRFYLLAGQGGVEVAKLARVSTLLEILLPDGRRVECEMFFDEVFQPFLRFYSIQANCGTDD